MKATDHSCGGMERMPALTWSFVAICEAPGGRTRGCKSCGSMSCVSVRAQCCRIWSRNLFAFLLLALPDAGPWAMVSERWAKILEVCLSVS